MSDALLALDFLFLNLARPACPAACDANADHLHDVSDALYLLEFQFAGGSAPVAPFPDCGRDPDMDDLLECRQRVCN